MQPSETPIETTFDVTGIGNAIVDVISHESEAFLEEFQLIKESMALVDEKTAIDLYNSMSPTIQTSGGSAANTMSGIASLGGSSGYIGKVRNDHLGEVFSHDIHAAGVHYSVSPAEDGPPTARSMIIVTPDGARTMNTFLGISTTLYKEDLDVGLIEGSKVLYCEGYIWDIEATKDTIRSAIAIAKDAGRKISFTLSDSFCVMRHHQDWIDLVNGPIDILFGNEEEIQALSGYETFREAINWIKGRVEIACLTRAEKGSVIVSQGETIEIEAKPVQQIIDSTGAGDLYAAGFLFGYTRGLDLATCGRIGSIAASEIIVHTGARPLSPLQEVISKELYP
ncbi:MAG: adenosine kinase [Acidimicrobiaceae bacterium]|nr:adenosine kinase [Acidimicrobiaceae bacterium]MEC7845290.1 adenosine kinase [Actinomycetota bacterium]